jgi:hypothetical protein
VPGQLRFRISDFVEHLCTERSIANIPLNSRLLSIPFSQAWPTLLGPACAAFFASTPCLRFCVSRHGSSGQRLELAWTFTGRNSMRSALRIRKRSPEIVASGATAGHFSCMVITAILENRHLRGEESHLSGVADCRIGVAHRSEYQVLRKLF